MEALWNLEDKWKLSTHQALLLLSCTAVAGAAVCTAVWIKKRNADKKTSASRESSGGWVSVKRALVGSVRWSKPKKWPEEMIGWRWREETPALVAGEGLFWSHNSASAVWQRPILMGEKCELPNYSGLILYDERGRLLDDGFGSCGEEGGVVVKTRLKDLL